MDPITNYSQLIYFICAITEVTFRELICCILTVFCEEWYLQFLKDPMSTLTVSTSLIELGTILSKMMPYSHMEIRNLLLKKCCKLTSTYHQIMIPLNHLKQEYLQHIDITFCKKSGTSVSFLNCLSCSTTVESGTPKMPSSVKKQQNQFCQTLQGWNTFINEVSINHQQNSCLCTSQPHRGSFGGQDTLIWLLATQYLNM